MTTNSATKKASKHSAKHKPTGNKDGQPTEGAHHTTRGAYKAKQGYTKQHLILLNTHKDLSIDKTRGTPKTYTKDYISKIIGIFFINKNNRLVGT